MVVGEIRQSVIGQIRVYVDDGHVTQLLLQGDSEPAWNSDTAENTADSKLLRTAIEQLEEYFTGHRRVFSLSLCPAGTPLMRKIWQEMAEIPFGRTASYGEIAARIGRPTAARVVGGACGRNPIPILIPCHRVVGADGSLTGFRGGLEMKQTLLALEGLTSPPFLHTFRTAANKHE